MESLGLYLHVPFCKSKCRYCDFCSFPNPKSERVQAYLDALCREIGEYGEKTHPYFDLPQKRTLDTVYFGGGTPTLLTVDDFSRVMQSLRRVFRIAERAEITAECNPATVDLAYLQALRAMGVNRLSIGAQSMQNNELRRLGRLHTADDVKKTFEDARRAGFDNISLDLMFGIPEQTVLSLADTLTAALALAPEHVSVYGLQIEDGTYFAKHLDTLALPDEETERAMYMQTVSTLASHGLPQYEISNFAKIGYESRHNLRYWHREDYLGLGPAAHSCVGPVRFSNTEDLDQYLSGDRQDTSETVSPHDILCETIMLGMRLAEGFDFTALAQSHGEDAKRYHDALASYIAHGFVTAHGERLSFTRNGMYVSNAILADVLDFEE